MTTFPRSPKVHKGALIGLDVLNPVASVIVFQYNPDTLTRSIQASALTPQAGAEQSEILRLKGPPRETIGLEVEIDAADQLEQAKDSAVSMGIYPTLSALEMLLYPKSGLVIANEVLLRLGIVEVVPPEAPFTVLVWGPRRIVPVKLSSLQITEEAFDPSLNPIRARVRLDLQVLTYQDYGLLSPGGALFMAHQIAKEVMATLGSAENLAELPSIGG